MRLSSALALAFGVTLAGASSAQSPSTQLVLSAGPAEEARADAAISSAHYAGLGPAYAVGLEHRASHVLIFATMDGGVAPMTALSATGGAARLDHGSVRLDVLAQPQQSKPTDGLWLGVRMSAHVDIAGVQYADFESTVQHFAFAYAALGPTARWLTRVPGGTAALQLSAPALDLVDHPYSDIKSERSVTTLRLASPLSLRGGDGSISYAIGSAPTGLVVTYRFGYLRFDDVQAVRSVSQSLTLGVRTRVGRGSAAR